MNEGIIYTIMTLMIDVINDVIDNGVCHRVIRRMKEWGNWLDDNDQPHHVDDADDDTCQNKFVLGFWLSMTERDAVYIVICLQRVVQALVQQQQQQQEESTTRTIAGGSINNNNNNLQKKKTVLYLRGGANEVSLLALGNVFDHYFRHPSFIFPIPNHVNTTNHLVTLKLGYLLKHEFRILFESLHTNISIKGLEIICLEEVGEYDVGEDADTSWFAELFRHKTDLTHLRFRACAFSVIRPVLTSRGLTHLQTLVFNKCDIGDVEFRLILEAIGDVGLFPVLKALNLFENKITAVGLRYLVEMNPMALRRLQKLNLGSNYRLLDDLECTILFVQRMLLPDDMTLRELNIGCCGEHVPTIIKACENDNNKLEVLDVMSFRNIVPNIRDQLMESMPKMKRVKHLVFNPFAFLDGNNRSLLIAALRKNTSIVKLAIDNDAQTDHLVAPLFNRNQTLKHADALLALQPATHRPIGSKSGIWYMAFAKMGERFVEEQKPQSDYEEEDEDYLCFRDYEEEEEEEEYDANDESDDDNASSVEEQESDEEEESEEEHQSDQEEDNASSINDDSKASNSPHVEEQGSDDEEQGSDDDEQESDDEEQGSDDDATFGEYTGASAIFKILQKRPAILEKQLRMPTAAAAAAGRRVHSSDGGDGDIRTKAVGGRKRRRL